MTELNIDTFKSLIAEETPVLVDFWAPWCMPCKIFSPVLEELSDEFDGKANFAKLNIDDFGAIAQEYGIVSIPTIILFKGGKPAEQLVGVRPKDEVVAMLEKNI